MSDTSLARIIKTNITGLSITIGTDGLWLNFQSDGKYASVNLSLDATKRGPIVGDAILAWCRETAVPTINIEEENWKAIKQAAEESNWIPEEYYMNDWVSDVCRYLREGCRNES